MSVVLWVVVALFVVSAVLTVTLIGKPRKPMTPAAAAVVISFQLAIVVAILIDRGVIRS